MAYTVSAEMTAAAAGNYDAADVVSNSATAGVATKFSGVGRKRGDTPVLIGADCRATNAALLNTFRMHFFNAEPDSAVCTLNDGTAASLNQDETYIGYVDLGDFVDVGAKAYAYADPALLPSTGFPMKLDEEGVDLWMVVETTEAETNEVAGMSFKFRLYFQ